MCPFHISNCLLLHWEGGGDTLISCPNNFETFPLLLEKAFHCLIWCSQLPASPGSCPLYLCLHPGSTVWETLKSHPSDTASPRREVLIAKSSLTTEASLPREHYHHPQPLVRKLRHKEIKNILITRGGCATGGNQNHSPSAQPQDCAASPLYRSIYKHTHAYLYLSQHT